MKNIKEPIRIAHIVGKWIGGGVEAVVMNYYKNIDRTKVQFDFLCDSDSTNIPYEEIELLGGKIILIPPYQKVFKYQKELMRIFKENNYKIVHSHINTLSVFPLRAAKIAGVPNRIAHSHSTSNKYEWKKNLVKQILKPFAKIYATDYVACTEYAGRWLFGSREYDNGNIYILNNAIDLSKYNDNKEMKDTKRKEIGIPNDAFVIGHVGRFVTQKNHIFLIKIFNEIYKKNNKAILILIGQGPLMEKIRHKIIMLGLDKNVKFLGQRDDVNELYQLMDVFVFPSIYEGLGMVAIESQFCGIKTIVSDKVPRDIEISNYIDFCGLDNIELWIESINKKENNKKMYINKCEKYDILKNADKLVEYYKKKVENKRIFKNDILKKDEANL